MSRIYAPKTKDLEHKRLRDNVAVLWWEFRSNPSAWQDSRLQLIIHDSGVYVERRTRLLRAKSELFAYEDRIGLTSPNK